MQASQVLTSLGYTTITSKSDKVLLESTQKALKIFGQSSYKDLIDQLRSKTGMSEIELIKNFHLFEDALKKSTGTVSAKIMIDAIKEEMIKHTRLTTITHKIDEIIAKVEEYGVYDFITNTPPYEHILVLYKDHETIDLILSDFFSKKTEAPSGLVSEFPTKIKNIRNITYDQISETNKNETIKKLSDWITNMHSCNTSVFPTKVAGEDCTWYIRNNFVEEHLHLESSLGKKLSQKMTILCAYDILKIPDNCLESLIKSHGYVILQNNSIVLYRAPGKN